MKALTGLFLMVACAATVNAGITLSGSLGTPTGMTANSDWSDSGDGFMVAWLITQNGSTWHYQYTFSKTDGSELDKEVSHFIISLSDDITKENGFDHLFNFSGDIDWDADEPLEFNTFGPDNSNPGFPVNLSITGIKINLAGSQTTVSFDSTRAPMWGDFYAKDGTTSGEWNYAWNTGLGVSVTDPYDYDAAVDKVLVPDTVPEPVTLALLGLGGVLLRRKR